MPKSFRFQIEDCHHDPGEWYSCFLHQTCILEQYRSDYYLLYLVTCVSDRNIYVGPTLKFDKNDDMQTVFI